eukprot:scaffold57_cov149-Skeletonema_menzelii.AAC.3
MCYLRKLHECGALHVYPYCVDVGTFECCGQNLCGGEDEHEGSCTDRHIVEKLDCGHEGCNYYGGACLSYENEKASKEALKSMVGNVDGKKRKREIERVEELEFNLKRARNACSA